MANEKRLIDANALQSELVERQYHDQTMGILHSYYPHFRDIVANQPTVDAVEVCFCKDCKYCLLDLSGQGEHLCMRAEYAIPVRWRRKADDFCSYGERRCG